MNHIESSGVVEEATATFRSFCAAMRKWELRCTKELHPLLYGDAVDDEFAQAMSLAAQWLAPVYDEFCPVFVPAERNLGSEPADYPDAPFISITRTLERDGKVWLYTTFECEGVAPIDRIFIMEKNLGRWQITRALLKCGRTYEELQP